MVWKFSTDKSIYVQIVEIITNDIICGKFKPGEKLPTVREMAVQAGVNPNTMQRAFSHIEQSGLIYTKRGDGRYVSEDKKILLSQSNEVLEKILDDFVMKISDFGLESEEVLKKLSEKLKNS